ncbi:MAG: hypothetical protein R3194_03360 [Limnobacter sp.]|nr:hypothetical protein [Limnobacter sp.]
MSVKLKIALSALLSTGAVLPAVSFACDEQPCTPPVEVSLNTDIDIDPDSMGVFVQNNTGHVTAITELKNLIIKKDGKLIVDTQAVANNVSVDFEDAGPIEVSYVAQSNSGNVTAITDIRQNWKSKPDTVEITTTALANNLSISTAGGGLSDLGAVQCNTGNVTAITRFTHDPKTFEINTVAVGNNLSIGR